MCYNVLKKKRRKDKQKMKSR